MPYCGDRTSVKYHRGEKRTGAKLTCRSWHCQECAPRRRKRLMAEIIGGRPNRFLTLTIRRSMAPTPERALEKLNAAWRTLRKMICQHYDLPRVHALVVVEKHQSGWPHMHIFYRGPWLDWTWLRNKMMQILDSPHVHIKAIDAHGRAAAYASKYCVKCNQQIGNKKRYYKTRSYELRPDRRQPKTPSDHFDHELIDVQLPYIVATWRQMGLSVEWVGAGFAIANRPP